MTYEACIALLEGCIRERVSYVTKGKPRNRDEALEFLFGEGLKNFLESYDIEMDLRSIQLKLLERLLDKGVICEVLSSKAKYL